MSKEKIFVVEDERRDWEKRIQWAVKERVPLPRVTRRYLMMVHNPQIRSVIRSRFQTMPYKTGLHEDIFYCVSGTSNRRPKEFIKSVLHFIQKDLDSSISNEVEILEGISATRDLMEETVVSDTATDGMV